MGLISTASPSLRIRKFEDGLVDAHDLFRSCVCLKAMYYHALVRWNIRDLHGHWRYFRNGRLTLTDRRLLAVFDSNNKRNVEHAHRESPLG